jgi:molybdopterin-guanine dinucleotide biosynthesis protein A
MSHEISSHARFTFGPDAATSARVVGVLLAGGRGIRMRGGGDKPLRHLAGRALLDHAASRTAPQVGALVINANGDVARFAGFGLPVVADTLPDFPGPLAGLLAGMRWAAANRPAATDVLSVPADTPFLPTDLVSRLRAARGSAPVALAASGGRTHPAVGLWPIGLADDLEAWLRDGGRKVLDWAARHGYGVAEYSTTPFDPFFNVNTPEDLARAETLAVPRGAVPREA